MKKITLDQLVEIAAEVEAGDPADWGKPHRQLKFTNKEK